TSIPAFACDAARRTSAPTDKAKATKSFPKRPSGLRGAHARLRRHSLAVRRDAACRPDAEHVRRVGMQAAWREAERVREAVAQSLREAGGPAGFEPSQAAARRRIGRADDDDPAAA